MKQQPAPPTKRQETVDASLLRAREISQKVACYLSVQDSEAWKVLVHDLKATVAQDSLQVVALYSQGKRDEAEMLANELSARQWLIQFPHVQIERGESQLNNIKAKLKGLAPNNGR